jgi:thioredoxin 1
VFTLDYDSGKDQLRQLKIRDRSTLVAYKGTNEAARVVGETDPEALRKLFEAAL